MAIKHATVKAPGNPLAAVADWNAEHVIDPNTITPAQTTFTDQQLKTTSKPTFDSLTVKYYVYDRLGNKILYLGSIGQIASYRDFIPIYTNTPDLGGVYGASLRYWDNLYLTGSIKDGTLSLSLAQLVPYTGATTNVNIGAHNFITTGAVTAGASSFGDGGVTNYVGFSATGDQVFVGSSGLPFGEIYAHSVVTALTSVAQNDWDQILAFDTNGESNNTTPDHTNDHITITKAGKYLVSFQWSGYSAAVPHDWDFHISKNNNASQFNEITQHQTSSVASRLYSVSATGIITCAVNDTIELWVKRTSAGNNIVLTTTACNITITQIGG